jgi:uncharacterized membrane protein YraQ (UPF0718 family)
MKDQECGTPVTTSEPACCGDAPPMVESCCGEVAVAVPAAVDSCCGDAGEAPTTACFDGTAAAGDSSTSLMERLQSLRSAWTLVVLLPLLVLALDGERFGEMLGIASSALAGTVPYILFAVLLIAYLKASGAENLVASAFVGRENRMIVLAALFGGLAPFCSCEVIPFIAGLLALGAPLSAVMAFWLSSPLIDPPSLMITAGALGWEFAIGKALAAVALGLLGGFGIKMLLRSGAFKNPLKNEPANSCSSGACGVDQPFSGKPQWQVWRHAAGRRSFVEQGVENGLFLIKWLTLAYLLEALLILYIPASLIGGIVGGEGLGPIVLGALVGMPAYLNSYAAPPLVAGLMEQGMSAGSAMAFMVAGAVSSIPAMTAVWSLVKRPVFAAYLGFGVGGAVLFGAAFALLV